MTTDILTPTAYGRARAAADVLEAVQHLRRCMALSATALGPQAASLAPDDAAYVQARAEELAWWERQAVSRAALVGERDRLMGAAKQARQRGDQT
jgi:hypothetical protein